MDSNKSRISFDEASHTYRVDGKIVPSVTQLLPKGEFFVSDERLAECAVEGTANHKEIEEFIRTGISTSPLTDAMRKFMEEQKDKTGGLVACEMPLASAKGFAGTADLIFENANIICLDSNVFLLTKFT